MQKYKYQAININKKKFSGTFLAESEDHLREELAKQNLFLISARAVADTSPNAFFSTSGKVKISEITNFCRQFSILTNSGISIVDSIGMLKEQSYTPLLKKVLDMVHEDVKAGLLLSEALEKHPKIFPEFFRSMTYVGEMSGSLDTVLNDLANYYEMDDKMRRQMKGAMAYPLVLVGLMVAILALVFVFVIPTFQGALADMDVEMPALTMAIFNMSGFIVDNWMLMFIIVILIVVGFRVYGGTAKGKENLDRLKLKLPIVKNINTNIIASRFAHGFGLLLVSGMDLVDSMKVMVNVFGNKDVEKRFGLAIDEVEKGSSLTTTLNKYEMFPQIMLQMVSVGEKTGSLDEILPRAAKYYDEQVEIALGSLTTVLQPIMLVVMGGVIGVVFMAVYGPILSIIQTIQ
ncbi:MAG: type II secretion system F family protein [Clostridiales bacterium]|nr:type II secretion system F family protein [Clostridiales bacterium]